MTQTHGSNDYRFGDFLNGVRELARSAAAANRTASGTLPELARRMVMGASEGYISLERDNDKTDDAARVYDAYVTEFSAKKEHTPAGLKANKAKLRTCVRLGLHPEGVETFERTVIEHEALAEADEPVKPLFAAVVDIARAQLNQDQALTDDEIRSIVRKAEPAEKTAERVLKQVVGTLEKLITGEAGCKDQDERVLQAHDLLNERLAALMAEGKRAAVMAEASALGMSVTPQAQAA